MRIKEPGEGRKTISTPNIRRTATTATTTRSKKTQSRHVPQSFLLSETNIVPPVPSSIINNKSQTLLGFTQTTYCFSIPLPLVSGPRVRSCLRACLPPPSPPFATPFAVSRQIFLLPAPISSNQTLVSTSVVVHSLLSPALGVKHDKERESRTCMLERT